MEEEVSIQEKRIKLDKQLPKSQLPDFFLRFIDIEVVRNKTAVIFNSGKGLIEELSYSELDYGANQVKKCLTKLLKFTGSGTNQQFIGVYCSLGRLYPILILGILRSGFAFYNLENLDESLSSGSRYLNLEYILTDSRISVNGCTHQEEITLKLSNLKWRIYKMTRAPVKKISFTKDIAYAIQTSGTTGRKKTVVVPHACISPNVDDFVKNIWNLTCGDVIFGGSPPTFDPHLVELFSALAVGATIVYTTSTVKLSSVLLAKLLAFHKVTVMQITPSLFRRLFSQYRENLDLPNLRVITLGGENFPDKEVQQSVKLFPFLEKVKFQNVYGVTEVSCWASVATVDLASPEPVTIGKAMSETEVFLEPDLEGEIVIKSTTRSCTIIDASGRISKGTEYRTGDLGIKTPRGILYQGRNDRVVKRNGMKICLNLIEESVISLEIVKYAECVMNEGKIYLVVKLKSECRNSSGLLSTSNLNLPLNMFPDMIICLDDDAVVPVNSNGKQDYSFIFKLVREDKTPSEDLLKQDVSVYRVAELLKPIWLSCTSFSSEGYRGSFIEMGGTSVSATRLIESLFSAMNLFGSDAHTKWEATLLSKLLDSGQGSFDQVTELITRIVREASAFVTNTTRLDTDLLQEVQPELSCGVYLSSESTGRFEHEFSQNSASDPFMFNAGKEILEANHDSVKLPPEPIDYYQFQMGLCVDASPVVISSKNLAICGCHGGILLCIDLKVLKSHSSSHQNAVSWKIKLPNRIEASAESDPSKLHVYVSCHDGKLYKISVITGNIICWGVASYNSDTGYAPIRSKCIVTNKFVVFIDSQNSITCVDCFSMNLIWRNQSFKLLATISPVVFKWFCVVPTLDEGIIGVDVNSGDLLWKTCNEDLIYSSPVLGTFKDDDKRKTFVYLASSKGLEARDPKTGDLQWKNDAHSKPVMFSLLLCTFHEKIVCIEGSTLKILCVKTGNLLGSYFIDHFKGIVPNLVCFMKECYLCYKACNKSSANSINQPTIRFVNLEKVSGKSREDDECCLDMLGHKECSRVQGYLLGKTDFETFSRPVYSCGYILFGGRDNNLHVIRLKQ